MSLQAVCSLYFVWCHAECGVFLYLVTC